MKIVSLFDGISCGYMAFQKCGIKIDKYYAYEIDKSAIKVSEHNFPDIIHCGNVFDADFSVYKDVDYLIGGSPCTHWSIARRNNRETEASGNGWELFQEFIRALHEIKPKFFIFENVASMNNNIKIAITEALGVTPELINSALFLPQNRKRLYWVGKRVNNVYKKVNILPITPNNASLSDVVSDAITLTPCAHCILASAGRTTLKDALIRSLGNFVLQPAKLGVTGYLLAVNNGWATVGDVDVRVSVADGQYLARRLTVDECAALQGIDAILPASDSVAYRLVGNGWTVDVITHIIRSTTYNG